MRLSRAVSLVTAFLLAVTLSQAFVSPSQAVRPSESQVAKKPKHDLVAGGTEVGNTNHFVVVGHVTTYPKVFLFRKIGTGKWSLYRKVKTHDNGKFRTRIFQFRDFRTCFKVGVPNTADYAQKIISVGCIYST